jgi:hypothetical protein
VHANHPLGKFCTCLHLDIGAKPAQHIVEECNLFVRIVAGTGRKKIVMRSIILSRCRVLAVASGLTSSSSTDRLCARALAISEFVLTGITAEPEKLTSG